MKKQTVQKVLLYVLFVFLALVILVPMAWMILNSLKTNRELFQNSLALFLQYRSFPTGSRHGNPDCISILGTL